MDTAWIYKISAKINWTQSNKLIKQYYKEISEISGRHTSDRWLITAT